MNAWASTPCAGDVVMLAPSERAARDAMSLAGLLDDRGQAPDGWAGELVRVELRDERTGAPLRVLVRLTDGTEADLPWSSVALAVRA